MVIFLSGKITNDPDYKVKFHAAQVELEEQGHVVLNPAMLPQTGLSWAACLRITAAMLAESDAVLFLPGWQGSKGAKQEHALALRLGKKVLKSKFTVI